MADTSKSPKVPSVVFGSSIDHMIAPLQKSMNATDDELTELKRITSLRTKKREPLPTERSGYGSPSIVIDDFLYHGDLGHGSNLALLNRLGIRHILNISNSQLDEKITDNFNVLWINLNDDFGSNIKKHFDETNQFLYNCKEKNEKVLVHCEMGISRSSSIVLAYLMKYHHDTLEKAYDYLLERRRMAAPNLSFFIQLIRYEKELRASKDIDETKNNDDKQNPIEQLDPAIENNDNNV